MNDKFSFEESYNRLEAILDKMNGKTVSLEESLSLYEEADLLIKRCTEKLDHAEKKIQIMIKSREGEVKLQDFDPTSDQILTRKE